MMTEKQVDTEKLIESLETAWEVSEQLLKKILIGKVDEVVNKLKNSPRQWKAIQGTISKLEQDVIGLYNAQKLPGRPLNVQSALHYIFGAQDLTLGQHRPDDVLYRVNLALYLGKLLETRMDNIDDLDCEQYLEIFETALFSQVTRSGKTGIPGDTNNVKETFDLALELRTQAFIDRLRTESESDSPYDYSGDLTETFLSGTKPKGWNIPGLKTSDLTQPQLAKIRQRFRQLADIVKKYQHDGAGIEICNTRFPLDGFVTQIFAWVQQRDDELVNRVEETAGGITQIQEAIDNEIARLGAEIEDDPDTIRVGTPASSNVASLKRKGNEKKRDQIYGIVKANINNPSRSMPEVSSAKPTSAKSTPARGSSKRNPASTIMDEEEENFEQFVGDDLEQYNESEEASGRVSIELATKLATVARENEKENLRPNRSQLKRSYLDAQSQARELEWTESPQRGRVNKGKKRAVEAETDLEDDDEEEISQDEGFQKQPTPPASSNKRRKVAPKPSQPKSRRGQTAGPTPQPNSNYHRSQSWITANEEAKDVVRMNPARSKPVQKRRAYSEAEIDRLMELMAIYGTSWAKIKNADEASGNILAGRDQVALKDKARNMLMDFLKANHELPTSFEFVFLKSADIRKLKEMGIVWANPGKRGAATDEEVGGDD